MSEVFKNNEQIMALSATWMPVMIYIFINLQPFHDIWSENFEPAFWRFIWYNIKDEIYMVLLHKYKFLE